MAVYKIPLTGFNQQPTLGESTYTFEPYYNVMLDVTMPIITMISTCGGEVIFQLSPWYGVTGDASTDPMLMDELTGKVDLYMSTLEV